MTDRRLLSTTMEHRAYVLLYDRDCGVCSAFGRFVHAIDLARRIRIEAIQSAGAWLSEIPRDRALEDFHMVGPDGRATTGGEAVPTLVEALPAGVGLAHILRGSRVLMAAVDGSYRFLKRFRDRLVCRLVPAAPSAGSGL